MCKLRPGFGQGAASKSLLPEDEDGESRLSDLLFFFFCLCGRVGGLLDKMGEFPFVLLFCCVSR